MVETNFLKEYYWGNINQNKEWIKLSQDWISILSRLREEYPGNKAILNACWDLIAIENSNMEEYNADIKQCRKALNKPE
jgi:hypothetical protein